MNTSVSSELRRSGIGQTVVSTACHLLVKNRCWVRLEVVSVEVTLTIGKPGFSVQVDIKEATSLPDDSAQADHRSAVSALA